MEIWFVIFPLLAVGFLIGAWIEIYENYKFNKQMRQRHMKELRRAMREWEKKNYYTEDEIKKLLELEGHKVKGVRTILSDGSIEELGEGTVYFDTKKVTATVGYEQLEEMGVNLNEADKLLKEAVEKKV